MTPDELFSGFNRHGGLSIADRIDASGDCWEWTGSRVGSYGVVTVEGKNKYLHRLVWETLVGPIPDGHEIDHLCRNRICCNPDHLEPVTRRENLRRGYGIVGMNARKHVCVRGHLLTGDNVYQRNGRRHCRLCRAARAARWYATQKGT